MGKAIGELPQRMNALRHVVLLISILSAYAKQSTNGLENVSKTFRKRWKEVKELEMRVSYIDIS